MSPLDALGLLLVLAEFGCLFGAIGFAIYASRPTVLPVPPSPPAEQVELELMRAHAAQHAVHRGFGA